MVEQRPVQTSAVYLLGGNQFPAVPPPSPPSPATPGASDLCIPIEDLDLGEGASHHHVFSGPATLCDDRLAGAVHVLATEATTLQGLARLYATDPVARGGFSRAVAAVTRQGSASRRGSKLVVVGVGKSGHIGRKLVATFNSLGVHAAFLHPTEALHGDLGQIGPDDTLLLITFSGRTPELLALLPHLDRTLPLILLTGHTRPETCELLEAALRGRGDRRENGRAAPACGGETILLPAPVHEAESVSFGVSAPTSSTAAALAVGDALAIVAAQELHGRSVADGLAVGGSAGVVGIGAVFATNHPGGAIGASHRVRPSAASPASPSPRPSSSSSSSSSNASSPSPPPRSPILSPHDGKRPEMDCRACKNHHNQRRHRHRHHRPREVRHLAVPWSDIPTVIPSGRDGGGATGADVLRAGYASASGWVRLTPVPVPSVGNDDADNNDEDAGGNFVVPPSRIRSLGPGDMDRVVFEMRGFAVRRADFIAVAADTSVRKAAEWVGGLGVEGSWDGAELEGGEGLRSFGAVVGVVEAGECIGVLELETLFRERNASGRDRLV